MMMKEKDIRPNKIFQEYMRLCELDNKEIFSNCETFHVDCPVCKEKRFKNSFIKETFTYKTCAYCNTMYVSPRPLEKYFNRFYKQGKSVRYWHEVFYPTVEEQRIENIYSPRAKRIKNTLTQDGYSLPIKMIDIGSGYGSFLKAAKEEGLALNPEGLEPNSQLKEICEKKGFHIHHTDLENAQGFDSTYELVTSFEVLEHSFDISTFIKKAYHIVKPGGVILLTSLSNQGYDIQMLGKDHNNVKPPHHINFVNPFSAYILMTKCGFKNVKIETPGKLDVDILCNRVEQFPYLLDDLIFNSLYNSDDNYKNTFQEFLVQNKLSSHLWIWAEK
jgi:SAM-dependent methyltransferase